MTVHEQPVPRIARFGNFKKKEGSSALFPEAFSPLNQWFSSVKGNYSMDG